MLFHFFYIILIYENKNNKKIFNFFLFYYIYICIYVQSADVRFAVLQLTSAARNELGFIRDQSAQIYKYIYIYIYIWLSSLSGLNAK